MQQPTPKFSLVLKRTLSKEKEKEYLEQKKKSLENFSQEFVMFCDIEHGKREENPKLEEMWNSARKKFMYPEENKEALTEEEKALEMEEISRRKAEMEIMKNMVDQSADNLSFGEENDKKMEDPMNFDDYF